jgi:site-specific recombinase XerD
MGKTTARGSGGGGGAGGEPNARLYWKNGRAYIDARGWARWGGKLEALIPVGERRATDDPAEAAVLFAQRLRELRGLRAAAPNGLPGEPRANSGSGEGLDRIATFAGWYMAEKESRAGRRRVTREHLLSQRRKLVHAVRFFTRRGKTLLQQLEPEDIREYMKELRTNHPSRSDGRPVPAGRTLSPTTQRRYLDTLGELLQSAVAEGRIATNWVYARTDLPAVDPSPTKHLEAWEAALLLEGARRLYPPDVPGFPVYPLLAFYLLTGVLESERHGVRVEDVRFPGDAEFPAGAVIIRPNASVRSEEMRDRLKSEYRERINPLHAQLATILREYLDGPNAPRGPLLFPVPSSDGTVPIRDWRKHLDRVAIYCGYSAGEIRTRRLRVTYCSHRAYTEDEHGQPMTAMKLQAEMGHGSFEMMQRRYFRHTRLRVARPRLEFLWDQWADRYEHRLGSGTRAVPDLTPKLARVLSLLPEKGLCARDWERRSGLPVGTFYYCRDVLVERGYVRRLGRGRGSLFLPADERDSQALGAAA